MSLIGSKETEPIFIPVESTAENALKLMIKEMNQIRVKYISELYYTNEPFFQQISNLQAEKTIKQVRRKLLNGMNLFLYMDLIHLVMASMYSESSFQKYCQNVKRIMKSFLKLK
jgi:hypothetical protein